MMKGVMGQQNEYKTFIGGGGHSTTHLVHLLIKVLVTKRCLWIGMYGTY